MTDHDRDYWAGVYEAQASQASHTLGKLEKEAAEEFLRLMIGGKSSWEAQKMVDVSFATSLRQAHVEYEIALARLRRV